MDNIISLCMVAKKYYEYIMANDNIHLHRMSMIYIKTKQYDRFMSDGVKERCINLIQESWNNVNNPESFYQFLLVQVSINELIIESLLVIFDDMILFCQDSVKVIV